MSANVSIQLRQVAEKGWRRGLGNLLHGEYSSWFKSSRWWKNLSLWISTINVMMLIILAASADVARAGADGPPILFIYGIFGGTFVAFGVMVIMQRVMVGEKRSGTAAWVLTKPVTRTAFVVSRLLVNSIAILLTSVIVPGVIFYISLGLFSDIGWLSPSRFGVGLQVVSLHTFFWVALVLMMGTLSESSSVVIAVPIGLYFGFWIGSVFMPQLSYIAPILLTFSPAPDQAPPLFVSLMNGQPVFSWVPLIVTLVSCPIFIIVALLRFNRQEF